MMYVLDYSPGSCSLAAHILLEHVGSPYEVHLIRLREGEQFTPAHRQRHPFARVPVLGTPSGETITENAAVCLQIALDHPAAQLWPTQAAAQVAAQTWVSRLAAEAHPAFRLFYLPDRVASTAAAREEVKASGERAFCTALGVLIAELDCPFAPQPTRMSVVAAMFYVKLNWAARAGMAVVEQPAAQHWLAAFEALPAVQRALDQEGLLPVGKMC